MTNILVGRIWKFIYESVDTFNDTPGFIRCFNHRVERGIVRIVVIGLPDHGVPALRHLGTHIESGTGICVGSNGQCQHGKHGQNCDRNRQLSLHDEKSDLYL